MSNINVSPCYVQMIDGVELLAFVLVADETWEQEELVKFDLLDKIHLLHPSKFVDDKIVPAWPMSGAVVFPFYRDEIRMITKIKPEFEVLFLKKFPKDDITYEIARIYSLSSMKDDSNIDLNDELDFNEDDNTEQLAKDILESFKNNTKH